jgi:hypothetical protein
VKVKANVSFSGIISMGLGEEREITDKDILKDLLEAGYVEEAAGKSKKKVKSSEDK